MEHENKLYDRLTYMSDNVMRINNVLELNEEYESEESKWKRRQELTKKQIH